MAGRVVLLGPLGLEQRLRPTVAFLLAPEVADRVAAVVPHERGRRETECPAALLEPPAQIDVVPPPAEARVPAADRPERALPGRAVAAWDVLGLAGRHQHLGRA